MPLADMYCPLCNGDMSKNGDFGDAEQVRRGQAYLQCSRCETHRMTAVEFYSITDTMQRRHMRLRLQKEKEE